MPALSVGTLLVQSSLGVWEMPGKRRKNIIKMGTVIILIIVGGIIWAIVSGINGRQEVKSSCFMSVSLTLEVKSKHFGSD